MKRGHWLAVLGALHSRVVEQWLGSRLKQGRIMSCVSQGCGEPSRLAMRWVSLVYGWFSAFREPGGSSAALTGVSVRPTTRSGTR